jgi:SAM-dependent methyltransferase
MCDGEAGVRCAACGAGTVHRSLGTILRSVVPDLHARDVCELSARGPLAEFLRKTTPRVTLSEYFADVKPGDFHNGVRCEDVQHFSYADASFDVITHTEVLEHVPDDARAFAELRRILRPGGIMVFTVPFHGGEHTVERAVLRGEEIDYLLPPVYHTDPLRNGAGILAYRDYGNDIVDRLRDAGFVDVTSQTPKNAPWGYGRTVVVAHRPD